MNDIIRRISILLCVTCGLGCTEHGKGPMNASNKKSKKPDILVGHVADESELPEGIIRHEARDPDEPARVDRKPRVVDDANEIDRMKKLFNARVSDLYAQALERVNDGDWIFLEHQFALNQSHDRAIADLRAIVDDAKSLPAGADQSGGAIDCAGGRYGGALSV